MTVVVQQAQAISSASYSGNFGSPVGNGDSVIFLVTSVGAGNQSSSAPMFNGKSPLTAVKLFEVNSPNGAGTVYSAAWLLPGVGTGSGTSVALTVTSSSFNANTGMYALDVSGLGTLPALDSTATPASTGSSTSTNPDSGSTSNIAEAPDLIVACAVGYSIIITPPGSPWTNQTIGGGLSQYGYQVVTSSGSSYDYNCTGNANNVWSAGVAAIAYGIAPPPIVPATYTAFMSSM